jgi:hypothetical protein
MKSIIFALAISLSSCAFAQKDQPASHFTKIYTPGIEAPVSANIYYGGGPVMSGSTNLYVVFYGSWPTKSVNIINGYLQRLGGTHYYNVNTTYSDTTGAHIQNVVHYNPTTNSYNDNYSMGKTVTDAEVQTIISNAIAGGHLPNDQTNGVYFVLTAKDVSESNPALGSFCVQYCGYHGPSNSIVTGQTIKYAVVGNPAQCSSGCDGNVAVFRDATTPNGDVGGDGTISIMFHELSESVSDPNVTFSNGAWGDLVTGESGDMCNFTFGTTKTAANGSHYNETINKTNYLIQQMFKVPTAINGIGYYTGTCITALK